MKTLIANLNWKCKLLMMTAILALSGCFGSTGQPVPNRIEIPRPPPEFTTKCAGAKPIPEVEDGDVQEAAIRRNNINQNNCKYKHGKMVEWAEATINIIETGPL